jgi:hypothetical protein
VDCILDRGIGDNVMRKSNAWEILYIFMVFVDEGRQFLRFTRGRVVIFGGLWDCDFFFKHPHLYLLFEDFGMSFRVFRNDLGNGGSPGISIISR